MSKIKFVKKNSILLALLINIILLAIEILWLQNSIKAATFDLVDLYGNRNELNGVRIMGSLNDGEHSLEFSLEDGRIITQTIVYDSFEPYLKKKQNYPLYWSLIDNKNPEILASISSRISKSAQTMVHIKEIETGEFTPNGEEIIQKISTVYSDEIDYYCDIRFREDLFNRVVFKTGIYRKSESMEFKFEDISYFIKTSDDLKPYSTSHGHASSYNQPIFPKIVKIGQNYYVSAITNEFCRGFSGIYRIDEFEQFNYEAEKIGKVTKLVEVDLQGGNLRVIGLEAVRDKLLLLLTDNNNFVIQLYDLEGKLLDEIKPDITKISGDSIEYLCFINDKNVSIAINSDGKLIMNNHSIISFSVEEKLKLNHTIKDFETKTGRIQEFFAIEAVDEKLIIINGVYETEDIYINPPEILISIFDISGELKYQGEILTDMKDDYLNADVPYRIRDWYTYPKRSLDIFVIER